MVEKSKRDEFLNAFFKEEFGVEKAADLLKAGPEQLRAKLADRGVEAKALGGDAVAKARAEAMGQVGELIISIIDAQDQVDKQVTDLTAAHAAELQKRDTRIEAIEKAANTKLATMEQELTVLRTIVNAPPRRPSQDSSTVVSVGDPVLKDALPAGDPLQSWLGLPMKPKTS